MDFTPAQRNVIASNMAYLSKYLDDKEIGTLRDMTERTDLDAIDCHEIINLILSLHGRLSFNERLDTSKNLSQLIDRYART